MKPEIRFRAMTLEDVYTFCHEVGFYPDGQFGGIVAFHDDKVMGMVGFDDWTKTSVRLHWFIKQPRCLMPLWREVVTYLDQHGRKKAVGMTPSDNIKALRMIFRHLGFVEVGRIKDGYDEGIDLIISECDIHGQISSESTDKRPTDSRQSVAA